MDDNKIEFLTLIHTITVLVENTTKTIDILLEQHGNVVYISAQVVEQIKDLLLIQNKFIINLSEMLASVEDTMDKLIAAVPGEST